MNSASKRRRPPPKETRAAVLAAARRLFGRRGYEGASIRAITREARANLGAVTYHFGSKRALYDAVLEQALAPLAARVQAAVESDAPPLDRAEQTVLAYFEHLQENPDMPVFMLQGIVAGRTPPAPVARTLRSVIGAIQSLVRQGQEGETIRAGDPILFAFSLVAQPVHLALAQRMARDIVGLDASDPTTRARITDHARAFVRAGLRAGPEAA